MHAHAQWPAIYEYKSRVYCIKSEIWIYFNMWKISLIIVSHCVNFFLQVIHTLLAWIINKFTMIDAIRRHMENMFFLLNLMKITVTCKDKYFNCLQKATEILEFRHRIFLPTKGHNLGTKWKILNSDKINCIVLNMFWTLIKSIS